ncbi:protein kinase domain containing protein [Stylonychia lemnae]|uniref:non-specific serine/threonine protein kinase n=1 Tax=Stylonychia lemnae TaxID=5949 RepID=A0A078AAL6_STYLE|nr:protein kinase domain containing protein [Stylonychia lemnae]|eukprot:CDW79259.1 protein kinase domain containing protein [Stylonychia lemnae]
MEKYEKVKQIGRGTFGDVLLVKKKDDEQLYAMKRVPFELEQQEKKEINNEIAVLKTLNHPNVVKYYESFLNKNKLCIVMDFAENEKNKRGQNTIKALPETASKIFRVYLFRSLICMGQKYDYKSDTWMLGCILYELCTLRRPFEGDNLNQVINKIIYQPYIELNKDYEPIFHKLLDMLLQKNTILRASIDEVLSLPQIQHQVQKIHADNPNQYQEQVSKSLKQDKNQKPSGSPKECSFTFVGNLIDSVHVQNQVKTEQDCNNVDDVDLLFGYGNSKNLQRLMSPQKEASNQNRFERFNHQQNKSVIGRPSKQLTAGSDDNLYGHSGQNKLTESNKVNNKPEPKTPELNRNSGGQGAAGKIKQNSIYYLIQQAKKVSSPNQSNVVTTQEEDTQQSLSPLPFGQKNSSNLKVKENVDDADEELGDEEERKGRREIIPSVFSNSRNLHDKAMLSYNQLIKNSKVQLNGQIQYQQVQQQNLTMSHQSSSNSQLNNSNISSSQQKQPNNGKISQSREQFQQIFGSRSFHQSSNSQSQIKLRQQAQQQTNQTAQLISTESQKKSSNIQNDIKNKSQQSNNYENLSVSSLQDFKQRGLMKNLKSIAARQFPDNQYTEQHQSKMHQQQHNLQQQQNQNQGFQQDEIVLGMNGQDLESQVLRKPIQINTNLEPSNNKFMMAKKQQQLMLYKKRSYNDRSAKNSNSFCQTNSGNQTNLPTSTNSNNNQTANTTASPFNNTNCKKQAKTPQDQIVSDSSNSQKGKHFLFSENLLFNPELPISPNRPLLFSNFLKQKIGEDKFEQVLKILENSDNPIKLLEEDQGIILEIIGENNIDCLKVFKYIVSSCNSTPNNAGAMNSSQKQHLTPSTQYSNNLADSVINYNNSIEKNPMHNPSHHYTNSLGNESGYHFSQQVSKRNSDNLNNNLSSNNSSNNTQNANQYGQISAHQQQHTNQQQFQPKSVTQINQQLMQQHWRTKSMQNPSESMSFHIRMEGKQAQKNGQHSNYTGSNNNSANYKNGSNNYEQQNQYSYYQ